jgi:VCBS repeat-containing protein
VAEVVELVIIEPPETFPDVYTLKQGKRLKVRKPGVLSNDNDPDEGDTLTAELLAEPSSGALKFNQDGSFVFTPEDDMSGAVVTFAYIVIDDDGARSKPATVTITIHEATDRTQRLQRVRSRTRTLSRGAVNNQANSSPANDNIPTARENPARSQPQHVPVTITIRREE